MKHTLSFPFFLLVLVASPFTISGNLQNVYALTPVADLTGEWSGTGQFTSNYYDVSCANIVSLSAKIKQSENNVSGTYSFVGTSAKDLNPDPEYGDRCMLWEASGGTFTGQLDGSKISVTLSDDGLTYKGTYTSRLIKLSVSTAELSGTIQLTATSLSSPNYQPESDSDGDGISDNKDQCPSQKEDNIGNREGCPEKNPEMEQEETEVDKITDSDGDDIPDFIDFCVDKAAPGTKFGCPTQETKTSPSDVKILDNELTQIQEELSSEDWAVSIEGETPGLLRDEDDENKIVSTPNWAEGGNEGGPIIQKTNKELIWDKLLNTLDKNSGKISRNKGTETIIDSDGNVVRSDVFKIGQKIKTGSEQGTNIQINIGDGTMNLAKNTEVIQTGLELSPDDLSDEKSLMTAITEKLDSLNDKEKDALFATSLFTGLSLGTVIGTATIGGPVVVPSALIISGFAVLVGGAYFETYPEDIPFKTNQISEIFSAYASNENIQRVIFTPHAVLFPYGTKFLVEVTDEETKLDVMEGEVSVVPLNTNNPVTTVKAGNSISISDKQIEQDAFNTSTIDEWWKISAQSQPTSQPPPQKSGGCLIATAAYGTELAPQVQKLREIRDNKLLQTESGSTFMNSFNNFYYSFSPAVADYERENPVFKEMVRITLTPMISSLSILNYVDMDSETSVLGYGISLILLNLGMYFVAPTVVIHIIRKKF